MASGGLRLLFDEMYSHRHVSFLNAESELGEMVHIRERGWSGRPDKEWVPLAVQEGFVIVTGDRNDRTRGYTVADLKRMQARVVLVGPFMDHMRRWERAKWWVRRIEAVAAIASQLTMGSVTMVDRNARPTVL